MDVQFNNRNSSAYLDKTTSQNRPSTSLSHCNGSSKIGTSNGNTNQDSASDRLEDEVFYGDNDETGVLCTIPEEQPSTCATITCEASSLPTCRRFPVEQANPADVVQEADHSPTLIETMFDGDEEMPDYHRSNSDGSASMPSLPWSTALSASSATSVSSREGKNNQAKSDWTDGLTHLDSLDCLMHERPDQMENISNGSVDTATTLDKTRQKLHQHAQELVRKMTVAHQTSSDTDADESATALRDLRINGENKFKGVRLAHTPLIARPLGCTKLLKRRQLELWRNYIDNIAPSLDVCANKWHFQHTLPMLAKSADHLHYAVLALSSRHLENQESTGSDEESSGLQQDAINLLLTELHTLDTPTIATCVLLCAMDLLSAPATQCNTSLSICASLIDIADINARSGGFRQALFWCFANFAVWQSLSHLDKPTVLPTRSFYPSDSLASTVNHIRSLTLGDGYAKYAVFLTSTIIEITSDVSHFNSTPSQANAQYAALTDLLSDWSNCRPEEMQPLMSYPSILDDQHNPFPMVLYPTIPAAVGNLLYHCSSILLVQNVPDSNNSTSCNTTNTCNETSKSQNSGSSKCKPPETPLGKGITWHARQICGILSESHDPAVLMHGRHALDIAAKVMAHSSEKAAILGLLERIERVTGWKTVRG